MLCLLQDIGQVILDPEVSDPNVRSTIFYRTPREKLQKVVEETGRMIRPADDSHFDFFARRYNYIRRFSPAFLGSITFHANTPYNSLLEAADLLRDLDKKGPRRRVPDDAPLEFITEKKWRPYLFDREGRLSRRDSRTVRALGAAKRAASRKRLGREQSPVCRPRNLPHSPRTVVQAASRLSAARSGRPKMGPND